LVERVEDEDEEQSTRDAFAALRRHVVRVSSDFGVRLAVRLLALAAARGKGDPSLLVVFGRTMSEAVSIVVSPLASVDPSPSDAPSESKDDDDERS
jgi:hypothetical protein